MHKKIPLETLIRIYRAKPGDIVDGKYVRMHGQCASQGYEPNDIEGIDNYTISITYSFTFKDLTDGCFWYYGRVLERAADTGDEREVSFNPLFVRENEIDPVDVTLAPIFKRTNSVNEPYVIYN